MLILPLGGASWTLTDKPESSPVLITLFPQLSDWQIMATGQIQPAVYFSVAHEVKTEFYISKWLKIHF